MKIRLLGALVGLFALPTLPNKKNRCPVIRTASGRPAP